jgi:hypothetical protein
MKKILLLFIFLLTGCNTEKNSMIISGEIDGLRKGTLYLQTLKDSLIISLDSVKIDGDSKYKLKTNIEEPDLFYLYLDKYDGDSLNDVITFFGNKGDIIINSRLQTFDSGYEISGSKNSELLNEYLSIIRQYNFQNLDLLEIFYNAQIENNQDRIDSVNLELENLIRRKYLYSLNFAITNSDYEISPYIAISQIPDANKELLLKLYDTLSIDVKNSKYGKLLKNISQD